MEIKLFKDRTEYYNDEDRLHKEDGPAIEYVNGNKEWWINGKLHREDGPAIEWANGNKWWYINGKLHREDGPTIEGANGNKWWYINGKLHRKDGPAIEFRNGNGKKHREDDPAIECYNGSKYWYKNGKLHRENGPAVEYVNGDKEWWLNGQLHREGAPALEYQKDRWWYEKGMLHRSDGPAIELGNGTKFWCVNNKWHREDGPAIERSDGTKEWWINGERKEQKINSFAEAIREHRIENDPLVKEGIERARNNFLNDLAMEAYEIAKEKGFHSYRDPLENFGKFTANLHSEVSELWEKYRTNELFDDCDKAEKMQQLGLEKLTCAEEELADILIRTLDLAYVLKIDIDKVVKIKNTYNKSREYRHGNKLA